MYSRRGGHAQNEIVSRRNRAERPYHRLALVAESPRRNPDARRHLPAQGDLAEPTPDRSELYGHRDQSRFPPATASSHSGGAPCRAKNLKACGCANAPPPERAQRQAAKKPSRFSDPPSFIPAASSTSAS